jgi:NADH-quinone oxidoreductase subunit N
VSLIQSIDYAAIAPPVVLVVTGLTVLVTDLFVPVTRRTVAAPISLVGTLGALGTAIWLAAGSPRRTFCLPNGSCSYVVDDYASYFEVLFLAVLIVVLLLSLPTVVDAAMPPGEFHALLLWSVSGMLVLASARDLITLVVALEVVSIPAIVLVGLRPGDARGGEAALKFFLFSVVSTALTVYGIALLYGATGRLDLAGVALRLGPLSQQSGPTSSLAAAAVVLVLVGFAFKVSAVPFHFWAPDTYQGAPLPVAAFLSVASKAAGFAGLLVLLITAFPAYADVWGPVLAGLAAVTMTVGNLVALRQWHLVRLLAWSTVAQAGYMLVPLGVAASAAGRSLPELHIAVQATLVYLGIYAAMNLGAFACAAAVVRRHPRGAIDDFRGLGRRSPLLAVTFAVFLTALAGLPPGVAGLFAKVVVLRSAVHGHVTWLAVIAAVNAVIGLAYYLRVAALLFVSDGESAVTPSTSTSPSTSPSTSAPARRSGLIVAAVATAAAVTAVLSVYPQPVLDWASHAAVAVGAPEH